MALISVPCLCFLLSQNSPKLDIESMEVVIRQSLEEEVVHVDACDSDVTNEEVLDREESKTFI